MERNKLPAKSVMNIFLNIAACVKTMLKVCVRIRDVAWRIFNTINNQFETIFVIDDTYKKV